MSGNLVLIPTSLGDTDTQRFLPREVSKRLEEIRFFVVEQERTARRFLKKVNDAINIDALTFNILNKHTAREMVRTYLKPCINGEDVGLMSESGLPAVADPGAELVRAAHQMDLRVVPLVGPSSIFLALMSSGLNGQNFAFSGYLPRPRNERIRAIRRLEKRSVQERQTQIFMETPYRNNQLLSNILEICHPRTLLCIAADITLEQEFIKTRTIEDWKKEKPDLNKRPAIFLLYTD